MLMQATKSFILKVMYFATTGNQNALKISIEFQFLCMLFDKL